MGQVLELVSKQTHLLSLITKGNTKTNTNTNKNTNTKRNTKRHKSVHIKRHKRSNTRRHKSTREKSKRNKGIRGVWRVGAEGHCGEDLLRRVLWGGSEESGGQALQGSQEGQ